LGFVSHNLFTSESAILFVALAFCLLMCSQLELPVHDWLCGPLRGWADDLLDPALLNRQGYLDPNAIQDVWQRHLMRKENSEDRLWAVLLFQAWSCAQPH